MGRVKQAKERLGVEITLVESREQSDYELNIRKLASQNYDMTVGVGFLLTDAIVKVAEESPRSNFALIRRGSRRRSVQFEVLRIP